MGTYQITYVVVRFENEVTNREPIYNAQGEEIDWYAMPTMNVTIKTSQGEVKNLAVQFRINGELRINNRVIPSGHDITNGQLADFKTTMQLLWGKTKGVLNDLIEEQDMS